MKKPRSELIRDVIEIVQDHPSDDLDSLNSDVDWMWHYRDAWLIAYQALHDIRFKLLDKSQNIEELKHAIRERFRAYDQDDRRV